MDLFDDSSTSPLSRRLNAEWARLVVSRRVARRLAREPLAGHRDLATLLAATGRDRSVPIPEADAVLAAVVAHAAHDDLAARVALQRVLPGLVRVAVRRTLQRGEGRQDLFDELCTSAWLVIRTFPIERRPAKIAVNVLRDAEYHLCVRPTRLRSAAEVATPRIDEAGCAWAGLHGDRPAEAPAEVQVAHLLAEAGRAGFPPAELALLQDVYVEGRRLADIAAQHGCTVRTVYNRRQAATARLADLVQAA